MLGKDAIDKVDAFVKASKPENFKSLCGYLSTLPMIVKAGEY